jgi:hypothetical protein
MAGVPLLLVVRRTQVANRRKARGTIWLILVAALVATGFSVRASARSAKGYVAATLVETETYLPCASGCFPAIEPARAFCFHLGDGALGGEGQSYFHERKVNGMEDFAGRQVTIRLSRRSIWVRPLDGPTVKIARGSQFEGFKDSGCIAEVHKPILAFAHGYRRSAKIPADALAIAGSGKGDYRPLFLWFECAMEPDARSITCRRWYKDGEAAEADWFCSRTVDGAPVGADFAFDPLLSHSERVVLKTGAVLQHDNRGRTNGMLDRPAETCR